MLFQRIAKKAIEEIYGRGHIPILTGGTGFYIQSVLYDIAFTEETLADQILGVCYLLSALFFICYIKIIVIG